MVRHVISKMSMADAPSRTLRLNFDADALAANYRDLDEMSGAARAGAAVKADCYGLGVDRCIPVLRDAGCEHFFVAHWSEVEAVLRHLPARQITVLHGPSNAEEAKFAQAVGVTPTINSVMQAKVWAATDGGACHLMNDTGINRLGLSKDALADPAIKNLKIDMLMSHLACADEDSEMNARQLAAFRQARDIIPHNTASLCNSAGIALGSDYHFDMTRPGLALYGGVPRPEFAGKIKQVVRPEAAIIQVRELSAGDTVGYNATFTAAGSMTTAVVSIGYADGFLRSRGGKGSYLLYGDVKLPILGKVSMDMIVIDITDAPDLHEGDWVDIPFNLPNAAQHSGLSQYELLSTLGHRFG